MTIVMTKYRLDASQNQFVFFSIGVSKLFVCYWKLTIKHSKQNCCLMKIYLFRTKTGQTPDRVYEKFKKRCHTNPNFTLNWYVFDCNVCVASWLRKNLLVRDKWTIFMIFGLNLGVSWAPTMSGQQFILFNKMCELSDKKIIDRFLLIIRQHWRFSSET